MLIVWFYFPILFSLPIAEATRAVPRNIIISLYYPPEIENPYNFHIKMLN
jgi:hypothetical protein